MIHGLDISPHITYDEAVRSATAIRLGIDNTPSPMVLAAMNKTAYAVFEPLRQVVGMPLRVTSFFRCRELNAAIGGAAGSQHIKGEAIDLETTNAEELSNRRLFQIAAKILPFDQMIWEFGNDLDPAWVHVSYSSTGPQRHQILRAFPGGRYEPFTVPAG